MRRGRDGDDRHAAQPGTHLMLFEQARPDDSRSPDLRSHDGDGRDREGVHVEPKPRRLTFRGLKLSQWQRSLARGRVWFVMRQADIPVSVIASLYNFTQSTIWADLKAHGDAVRDGVNQLPWDATHEAVDAATD